MSLDELDSILSDDDAIVPSSGFGASVMEAVRQAASEPAPLPFPWWRLGGGMAVSIGLCAAGVLAAGVAPAPAVPAELSRLWAIAELRSAVLAVLASLALASVAKSVARARLLLR